MGIVQEVTDKFPFDEAPQVLRRQEELLLADPLPGPVKLWQDQSPLEAVHFPQAYRPQKFAPPRGVYEGARPSTAESGSEVRQPRLSAG